MIDTHCHLDFKNYKGKLEQVIAEAADAGVQTLITIGVDLESSRRAIAIAEQFNSVYATVGFHPHDARKMSDDSFIELREMANHDRVVGIGEIGLDFYRDLSPRDVQAKVFRRQLEMAIECKLPIVIHTRESLAETVAIIKEYASTLVGGVFHCFPGTTAEALTVIDLGFHISVGGVITFKGSGMSKVAQEAPIEKIILETDSPYLTPAPYRGKENQPAYVKYVYEKMAELRKLPLSDVEKKIDRTANKLFRLVETFGD
jgi:TatD DNase family protein